MTREQKLSLILGFALVLVVGVLVSDHLSGARKVTLDATDPGTLIAANNEPVVESAPTLQLVNQDGQPIKPPTQPAPGVSAGVETRLALDPSGAIGRFREQFNEAVEDLRNGGGVPAAQPTGIAHISLVEPEPAAGAPGAGEPERGASAPVATPGPTRSIGTPEYRLYTVKEGDTLWSISSRLLGDGSRHKDLAEYNKGRLNSDGGLRVGASLKIPAALMTDTRLAERSTEPTSTPKMEPPSKPGEGKAIKGAPAPVRRQTPAPVLATKEASAPAPNAKGPVATRASDKEQKGASGKPSSYTVKAGDTLGKIAAKTLGSSRRADELAEYNASALDDEDTLHVGMVLKIPAR